MTISVYVNALTLLTSFLRDPDVYKITEFNIKAFHGYLRTNYKPNHSDIAGRLSTASLHRYWKATRSFCKWASSRLGIKQLDKDLKMPQYENKEIVPYTQIEVMKLLAACDYAIPVQRKNTRPYFLPRQDTLRNKAIILFLLDSGVRPAELCRLRIEDVDLLTGRVRIKPYNIGKTAPGVTHIAKTALAALRKYLSSRTRYDDKDFLFTRADGHSPLTRHALYAMIRRLGERAKV